jgi:serine/threonine protein kinase
VAERLTPFGKYFLLERINVGGMAEVYKAKTVGVEGFEKIVAIKRILPSIAEDEEFIKMFVDEAKITSQLSHANLAQTFDLGRIDDTYYIAMEYVPGKDLRAVFERMKRRAGRMPLPLAAWVMGRVCEGLDYAHRKRDASGRELHIVHRDVSPQNIILSYEGEVKLIDFGIAKAANKITKTQAGILKGKFGYMSPEQVRGLPLDGRSDIFAAGVVLYELCTGERLFTGSSDFSVLEKVQQAKVTPPSQVEPSIPLKLERVILKALAREPEDRYQQAADIAADLTRFLLDTQRKAVTRDDITAFMKETFSDDLVRDADDTRPRRRPPPELERKPPPRVEEVPVHKRPAPPPPPPPPPRRSAPPPLPSSLTEGLVAKVVGEDDPDRTIKGRAPGDPRAEIIVRSKLEAPPAQAAHPEPGDGPTRPMSMDELAAAEREYAQREKRTPSVVLGEQDTPTPTPDGPPAAEALAAGEEVTPTPVERPARPPRPAVPRATPPPLPVPLEEQKTQLRPAPLPPAKAPPFMGRMQVNKPTLAGADPLPPEETTNSTLTRRARWVRRIQYGVVLLALGIAAWALISTPRPRRQQGAGVEPASTGSLSVTVAPADAQLLLDGARVKDRGDPQWSEPRLTAGTEHILTARKEGYADRSVPVILQRGEQKSLAITLERAPNQITVLSSPPGAQVFVDGVRKGVTPAFLPSLDTEGDHAISVEKKCYRSWQMALPARAGSRQIAATLEPAAGACPGSHLEKTGMPAPADLPEEVAAGATLGFLSLGSRPSAQVLIDGVDIGHATPLVAWPLKSGTHRLRLQGAGRRKELSVEIRTGETHSEIVDLAPQAPPKKRRGRR